VAAWQLGSRRVTVPAWLRPGNCPGAWWRVSPNDVVERTDSPAVDRIRTPVASRGDRPAGAADGYDG
jgi:hypothetical protein